MAGLKGVPARFGGVERAVEEIGARITDRGHEVTVFDLMLPRILAGDGITREDLARLAHGGLCLDCESCRFPDCPFGR